MQRIYDTVALIIGIFLAIVLAIVLYYMFSIINEASETVGSIQQSTEAVVDSVREGAQATVEFARKSAQATIDFAKSVIEEIKTKIVEAWEFTRDLISSLGEKISDMFGGLSAIWKALWMSLTGGN